jgi:nitrogenase molybdenum-iron cofactor biosynthesis protein NifN
MTEVATVLGGEDNIEQSLLTILEKNKPTIIGLCSTGLTETRGEDMDGILKSIRKRRPELADFPIVYASTPDFKGALQDGFAAAVEAMLKTLPEAGPTLPNLVTVLVSSAYSPGDVEAVKDMVADFGLEAVVVPDLSISLDGHLDDSHGSITGGGTTLEQLRQVGRSVYTLVLGESLRGAGQVLEQRFGIPYEVFSTLTGLAAVDEFLQTLHDLSGVDVPERYRHQRRQLQDAMLDTHFYFGRKRIALALEPDLLWAISNFATTMGCEIHAAITTTKSPLLEKLPIETVILGDLEDLERLAVGADLLITNSNGAAISRRLGIPLQRMGFPVFDRLGNGLRSTVGYRGTTQLLFEIGNLFLEAEEEAATHHYQTLTTAAS